jgi:hypothetical protein
VHLKNRGEEEITKAMKECSNYFRHLGWTSPKKFWWDGEKGAVSSSLNHFADAGISINFTAAEQHERKAEAMTKVIHNAMRCIFLGQPYRLPYALGGFLFEHAVRTVNHLCEATMGQERTRWEHIHQSKLSGTPFRAPFGALVYVKEPRETKGKHHLLAQRNRLGIVVRQDDETNNVVVMSLDGGKGLVRRADFRMAQMTNDLVRVINAWADDDGPLIRSSDMILPDRLGLPMSPTLGQGKEESDWEEEGDSAGSESEKDPTDEENPPELPTRSSKRVKRVPARYQMSTLAMAEDEFDEKYLEKIFFTTERTVATKGELLDFVE